MSRKIDFIELDEARIKAGFFVENAIQFLAISRRTWYRWKERKTVPKWAYSALSIKSGDLTQLGWKGFFLEDGVLYKSDLNRKYYNWKPADLMVTVFCNCNSHQYLREQRKKLEELRTPSPAVNGSLFPSTRGEVKRKVEQVGIKRPLRDEVGLNQ